jgi:DNA-binding LytR/AlgR family response regulator
MLIIAICDDNAADRIKLYETIESYLCKQGVSANLFAYDNPYKLNSVIESKTICFDIIFLDIIMDDMNGMTCARIIRKQDKLVNIIFLTSSTDYVYEGYEVNATGYLVKPIQIDQLAKVMERAIAQIENAEKASICIAYRGVTQKILTKDILYLESENDKVNIVLAKTAEKITVYTKLDEFEQTQQLNTFIRSHKSYLVNFLYIEKYENDRFVLTDGTAIPISRTNKEKARDAFYKLLNSQ